MRVTVFGGSGKIGCLVVEQLLTASHEITVLVRTPTKLMFNHPRLIVLSGKLSDLQAVGDANICSDAVISALGPSLRPWLKGPPLNAGTRTIVIAMRNAGVSRFIGLAYSKHSRSPRSAHHTGQSVSCHG